MSRPQTENASSEQFFPARTVTFEEVQQLGYKVLTIGTKAAERYVSTPSDQRIPVESDPEFAQALREFQLAQRRLPQPGYIEAES